MNEPECENVLEVGEGPSICLDETEQTTRTPHSVQQSTGYGIKIWTERSFDDAVELTRRSLGEQGFGVLHEVDVQHIFAEKLNVSFPRYKILGACDPKMAHQALLADKDLGLLLPCNVVVYEHGGGCVVTAIDPIAQMAIADGMKLHDLAVQIKQRLRAAIDHVASAES